MILASVLASALAAAPAQPPPPASGCVDCHRKVTPNIVSDWKLSRHSQEGVACDACHGDEHHTARDANLAQLPTPETCATCHEDRVKQFSAGKHALAWMSLNAMPTIHWQPMAMIEGQKGCGGCHKIGLKSAADMRALAAQHQVFGVGACDSCHTRHVFSVAEARSPAACRTCHMGFDHPQWEMYESSKHGVRRELVTSGALPATAAAPTCQTCHMPAGDHEVRTAWGFLALRLPMPKDPQWAADRTTILQALGVLDQNGKPTARLQAVKAADIVRLTQEAWQKERDRMLTTCQQCHARAFAQRQLELGDGLIKDADHLMAESIRTVAALYRDGILQKPKTYAAAFPDLLTFQDAPTVIEQRLFVMYLEHRMRTFQGAFHASPDYSFWYGWSEMIRDATAIRTMADEMRARAKGPKTR